MAQLIQHKRNTAKKAYSQLKLHKKEKLYNAHFYKENVPLQLSLNFTATKVIGFFIHMN